MNRNEEPNAPQGDVSRQELLRPWIPFIVLLGCTIILLLLAFMALNLLPTPSFMSGMIEGLRAALSSFERFFVDRFS